MKSLLMLAVCLLLIVSIPVLAQGDQLPWGEMNLMAKIMFVLIGMNLLMSSLGKMLDHAKSATALDKHGKASALIAQLVSWMQSLIDWLQGNRQHK